MAIAMDEPLLTSNTKEELGGRKTFPFITASMVGVGIGAYAVSANLSVYLVQQYNVPPVDSTVISAFVGGPTNLAPIVGGLVSDTCLTCFAVITLGCAAFSLGMVLFALTASLPFLRPPPCSSGLCKPPTKWQFGVLYMAIALMTIGIGGTRFTAATMGAGQSDTVVDQAAFFSWFVTGFYISSVLGILGIVYIQDNAGWVMGFGLCATVALFGLIVFLLGSRYYRKPHPVKNVFVDVMHSILLRAKKRKTESCEEDRVWQYTVIENGVVEERSSLVECSSSPDETQRAALVEDNDLSGVLRLVPLMITGIVHCIYVKVQLHIVFLQVLVMDRYLALNFSIPIGSIYVFMLLGSMVSIPLLDHLIYPAYLSLTGKTATPLQRIGIGFLITAVAMAYGAIAETKRLNALYSSNEPFSVLWLVPCLTVMGLGDVLQFSGQLAFFFQEFPASLKGSGTSVNALQSGIGSFLTSAAIELIRRSTGWIQDDTNASRLDNVYWMLAVIGMLNFCCFLVCAGMYNKRS